MKPPKDFGEKAREVKLANSIRNKRITRTFLVIIPLLVMAILVFAFGSDITQALEPTEKKSKAQENIISNNQILPANNVTVLQRWELPEILREISGLAWIDQGRFACVQDEMGMVFIYNVKNGSIEKEISFAGPGDYEGLTLVKESIWVIRSDGKLFEINSINAEKPVTTEYDTPLTAKQNAEGLCFDSKNNRLLIALKEGGLLGTDYKGIYSFDLTGKKLIKQPVIRIDLKNKIFTKLNASKKKGKKSEVMMPSGIAIHPTKGDIYITEGRNPKLLITDISGNIKNLYVLQKNDFSQPEGITFSSSGELFISNEGVKEAGNILKLDLPEN